MCGATKRSLFTAALAATIAAAGIANSQEFAENAVQAHLDQVAKSGDDAFGYMVNLDAGVTTPLDAATWLTSNFHWAESKKGDQYYHDVYEALYKVYAAEREAARKAAGASTSRGCGCGR